MAELVFESWQNPDLCLLSAVYLPFFDWDKKKKTAIRDLELNIKYIEGGLNRKADVSTGPLLQGERMKLSSILHEKVKGALVRSCVFQLKDMYASSSFFFNLEISVA